MLVHLYEEHGLDFARAAARHVRGRALGRAAPAGSCSRATATGSSRSTTATPTASCAFASELRALPRGEIDLDALEAFLAFNSIPAPLTIFRDVRKLPAGHVLVWERRPCAARALRAARAGARAAATTTRPSSIEELRARLRDSVRAHLVSDVPVGVLLSGGVDSVRAGRARRAGVGRAGAHVLDRLRGALVRRARPTRGWSPSATAREHRELVLRPDAALLLPALAEAFDEPFADSSALPTYLVSQLAAGDVKVALSGEGGDELFGGYYTYVADLLAERTGRLARLARPLVERAADLDRAQASLDYKAKRFVRAAHLPPLERHHGWKEIFSPEERARADRPPAATSTPSTSTAPATPRPRAPRRSRGCRTSTSASTSWTTCS